MRALIFGLVLVPAIAHAGPAPIAKAGLAVHAAHVAGLTADLRAAKAPPSVVAQAKRGLSLARLHTRDALRSDHPDARFMRAEIAGRAGGTGSIGSTLEIHDDWRRLLHVASSPEHVGVTIDGINTHKVLRASFRYGQAELATTKPHHYLERKLTLLSPERWLVRTKITGRVRSTCYVLDHGRATRVSDADYWKLAATAKP